jgi:hypothetical protein
VSSLIKDHLAGGASRLAALLLRQIVPVSSVVAPCQAGAALRDLVLVQRGHATREHRGYPQLQFARYQKAYPRFIVSGILSPPFSMNRLPFE